VGFSPPKKWHLQLIVLQTSRHNNKLKPAGQAQKLLTAGAIFIKKRTKRHSERSEESLFLEPTSPLRFAEIDNSEIVSQE